MVQEIIPKVFVLAFDISEDDHGVLGLFSSYELAKESKEFAENLAKQSPFFVRFRIDVYEVFSSVPESQIKYFLKWK